MREVADMNKQRLLEWAAWYYLDKEQGIPKGIELIIDPANKEFILRKEIKKFAGITTCDENPNLEAATKAIQYINNL